MIKAGKGFVQTCCTYISNTVASQELKLYTPVKQTRGTKDVDKLTKKYLASKLSGVNHRIKSLDEVQEIEGHESLKLLEDVNPRDYGFLLMSEFVYQLCLIGNSFWYVIGADSGVKKPQRIELLPSELVNIIEKQGKDKDNNAYLRDIDHYEIGGTSYTPNEIIHFRFPNPEKAGDQWKYGKSQLEAVIAEYNISGKLKDLQYDFAKNKPGNMVYLQTDKEEKDYSKEQKDAIKQAYSEYTAGNPNMKLMVVDKAGKLLEIPHSAKDLPFIVNLKGFREFIFNAYKVPISFVENDGNRAVQDKQDTQFKTYCIHPILMMCQSVLNSFYIPMFPDLKGCFFAYENCIPEDKLNQLKLDVGYVQSGIWSINDVLIEQGKKPVDGGDVRYIPANYVPITQAGQTPAQQGKEFAEAVKKGLESDTK